MVKQARINWVATNGSPGGVSILHFDDTRNSNSLRTTINNMISTWANFASDQWSGSIDPEVRLINTQTGVLEGIETVSSAGGSTGVEPGEPVADATAGLARYTTNAIVAGKRVIGRTFLPGGAAAQLENGQWDASALAQIAGFASAYAGDPGSVIWARPLVASMGSVHAVPGGTSWAPCAVLRHRRLR